MTKWAIYYFIRMEFEDDNHSVNRKEIEEEFKEVDKDIIEDGIRLYNDIYGKERGKIT